ncbi:MAG: response regulator [Nannocystales bacterium]
MHAIHLPVHPSPHQPAVLVVDDDPSVTALVSRWLRRQRRARVHVAHDGPTAIRIAATERVDAVFSDIELLDENGVDLVRVLQVVSPALPLCLMSARMTREQALRAHSVRVSRFVAKPLSSELIVDRLDAMLESPSFAAP